MTKLEKRLASIAVVLIAASLAPAMIEPAAAQKAGGTLRMYNSSNPPSASIHEETTIATIMSFSAVYNNLVRFDPQQSRNAPGNIQPELAQSWSLDASGTKLTFKLRDDVKWHDGKPFTAKDVQCTVHRLNGREPDYLRRNPRSIWYENVVDVSINGDFEATLNLKQPQSSLLSMLASGYSPMYPCHVSGRDMRVKPIGTGPFKFSEFKSNEIIRHVRNPDYWKKGFPLLDAVEWRIVPSRSTRILAFTAGEFDMTQMADITPPLLADIKRQSPAATCSMQPSNVSTFMMINHDKPPFDNAELRTAMMLGMDRKSFIDILTNGEAALAVAMMAPPQGSWGMPREELAKLPGYGDPTKQRAEAIAMMEKLGYGPSNRLKVKVSTRNFNTFRDPAVILVDQLNKIHFDAELDVIESSVWYNKIFKKDYTVALNLSGAGIDDPDGVLKMGFACKSDTNFSKYCNADIDRLLDQQSQETDPVKRKAIVWDIESKLVKDVARPIIFHGVAATCWHPHVKGYIQQENSIYNNARFEQVSLEK